MLSPETQARIPGWKARKHAQWERIASGMPGLQLVTSGDWRSRYMLVCSQTRGPDLDQDGLPGFYEGVVFGALPQLVSEFKRGPDGNRTKVLVPEERKPIAKRAVDLTDEEMDQVVAGWKERRSALDLPFVLAVYGRDGKMVTR